MAESKDSAPQGLYYRFAKLKAIREEEERSKQAPRNVSEADKYNQSWRSDKETSMWIDQQFDYTRQYVAEYSVDPEKDRQQDSTIPEEPKQMTGHDLNPEGTYKNGHDDIPISTNGETRNCDTNSPGADDVLNRLNNMRGKRRSGTATFSERSSTMEPALVRRAPPAPPSSCADFERTSTIMPPTEVSATGPTETSIDIDELRTTYFRSYKTNQQLPIFHQKRQIINSINSYSVVIIEGVTGCGKTTQVPMYILEDAIQNRTCQRSPVIYVTQPRKIAARSIADRICSEHGWQLGSLVGYQVSLEKVVGPQTVLVFCTAGVLLQKIIQEKSLKNYSHIIIDEAHERDADTDLLMMMIRKLMLHEMSLFRLIVMSATMDIEKLKTYFTFKTKYGHRSLVMPSHIKASDLKHSTNLQCIYLDKLKPIFDVSEEVPVLDLAEPDFKDGCINAAVEVIINVVPKMENYSANTASTLVFLPGMAEIAKMDRKLRAHPQADDTLDIFPLHSCLTVADQLRIFKPARPGCRKVILATNIAESSITLTDVGFIVDFCLTKTLMKDNMTRFPTLRTLWATQDKCTQRAGRTGRCCPGKVFRMVPLAFYQSFNAFADPELLTAPLELSALRVKNFGMGEIAALLAVVLDPPPYAEIRTAVLELKQIGALAATHKGQVSDIDGDITELGRVISALPIDVHLSKLIVLASVFDVLDDAIIVAACLSTNRTVVRYLYGGEGVHLEGYETRLDWARGTESDLFGSLYCYQEFRSLKDESGRSHSWLASWCNKNFLDERKLHDVDAMVQEIKARLANVNIHSQGDLPNVQRDPNMDYLMLKIAFCAAFYPNYFLTEKLDSERIRKELGGLDPTRTIIMSNLPVNQVPLYRGQVIKRLEDKVCHDMDYIADCSKALIVLNKNESNFPADNRIASALDETTYKVLEQRREIPKAMFMALKLSEESDIESNMIKEFKERPAMQRMDHYVKQRETLRRILEPRLIPTRMKVVTDRPANNQRLFELTDAEYSEMTDTEYYIEVECDHDQEAVDSDALVELEEVETQTNEEDTDHPIYKPGHKRIRGPTSPIRMSFRSVLVKSKGFSVEIDHQSVNSILLDPDYAKDRRQMLVAASVTQTNKGKVMTRDTTLMPNVRGMPSLCALLFAQYYRLVYNDRLHCIAGGIFGIGWDSRDDPIDRSYEVILGFDVHLTPSDIALINKARQRMSELLKFTEIAHDGGPQAIKQQELRQIILTLLRRRRYPLQELDVSMIYYQNPEDEDDNLFIKDIHNLPSDVIEEGKARPFLPLADFTRQYQELALYAHIRDNLDQMQRIDDGESMPPGGIRCYVCGNGKAFCFTLCGNLFTHLRSADHLAKVREFEWFEKRALESCRS